MNLLERVAEDEILRPKGYYRLIALDVLTVASALGASYSLKIFFENGTIIPFAASACLFLIFSCFEIFLIKNFGRRFFVLVLETAALLSFFYNESWGMVSAAGFAVIVLLFWGEVSSRSEARNSLEVRFFKTVKPLAKKITTALSLLLVLAYLPQWSKGNELIPKNWFEAAIVSSAGAAESFYPELNFHSDVRNFSLSFAKYKLQESDVYANMSPSMQNQALNKVAASVIESIKKYSGMNVSGKDQVGEVLYSLFKTALEGWRTYFGGWFLFVWAAAAFLVVRSFGAIFSWLAALFAFSIYELLVGLNVLEIRGESATREKVEFS